MRTFILVLSVVAGLTLGCDSSGDEPPPLAGRWQAEATTEVVIIGQGSTEVPTTLTFDLDLTGNTPSGAFTRRLDLPDGAVETVEGTVVSGSYEFPEIHLDVRFSTPDGPLEDVYEGTIAEDGQTMTLTHTPTQEMFTFQRQ